MKAVFGILSLLIVLGALALVAKHQLPIHHRRALAERRRPAACGQRAGRDRRRPGASAGRTAVRVDTARALQQGADRAASADQ